jgi:GDP-4-dehydro-6-deoxy-D-mannose reductase
MRVLITGVEGFVGRHVARNLLDEEARVAATFWEKPVDLPEVELHEADVRDAAAVERVVRAARPDVIVHLAGLSHVGESWSRPGDYFQVNVLGTENVVRAAAGARVLVASSGEVYGAVPEEEQPIAEDRLPSPGSPYALSKAAAERVALAVPGARVVVVRSFNLIGAGQARRFALPSFADQLAAIHHGHQEPVIHVGNLAARRDFVHVEAAARAYSLLVQQGEPGSVYNLASGRAVSIADALNALIRVSGVRATIEKDPARMRPVDQPLLSGDSSRLRALGWTPEPGFDEAIRCLWHEARAAA